MKILVIGAAGKTGSEVVKGALAAGHEVTGFVHDPNAHLPEGARKVVGDVLDPAKVADAVRGQDAVVDAIGGKTPFLKSTMETNAAKNVVAAMKQHGARRLVAISVLGEGESVEHASFLYEHVFMPTFLRGALKDKAGMEQTVAASDLEWVLVRPPVLTDGPATHRLEVLGEGLQKAHDVSRADLAAFLIEQVSSDKYVRCRVAVSTAAAT